LLTLSRDDYLRLAAKDSENSKEALGVFGQLPAVVAALEEKVKLKQLRACAPWLRDVPSSELSLVAPCFESRTMKVGQSLWARQAMISKSSGLAAGGGDDHSTGSSSSSSSSGYDEVLFLVSGSVHLIERLPLESDGCEYVQSIPGNHGVEKDDTAAGASSSPDAEGGEKGHAGSWREKVVAEYHAPCVLPGPWLTSSESNNGRSSNGSNGSEGLSVDASIAPLRYCIARVAGQLHHQQDAGTPGLFASYNRGRMSVAPVGQMFASAARRLTSKSSSRSPVRGSSTSSSRSVTSNSKSPVRGSSVSSSTVPRGEGVENGSSESSSSSSINPSHHGVNNRSGSTSDHATSPMGAELLAIGSHSFNAYVACLAPTVSSALAVARQHYMIGRFRQVRLLQRLPTKALYHLAKVATRKCLTPGEALWRFGDIDDSCVFVVEAGALSVHHVGRRSAVDSGNAAERIDEGVSDSGSVKRSRVATVCSGGLVGGAAALRSLGVVDGDANDTSIKRKRPTSIFAVEPENADGNESNESEATVGGGGCVVLILPAGALAAAVTAVRSPSAAHVVGAEATLMVAALEASGGVWNDKSAKTGVGKDEEEREMEGKGDNSTSSTSTSSVTTNGVSRGLGEGIVSGVAIVEALIEHPEGWALLSAHLKASYCEETALFWRAAKEAERTIAKLNETRSYRLMGIPTGTAPPSPSSPAASEPPSPGASETKAATAATRVEGEAAQNNSGTSGKSEIELEEEEEAAAVAAVTAVVAQFVAQGAPQQINIKAAARSRCEVAASVRPILGRFHFEQQSPHAGLPFPPPSSAAVPGSTPNRRSAPDASAMVSEITPGSNSDAGVFHEAATECVRLILNNELERFAATPAFQVSWRAFCLILCEPFRSIVIFALASLSLHVRITLVQARSNFTPIPLHLLTGFLATSWRRC